MTYLEGDVTIDGAAARIGDTVPLGAVVRTSSASLADIGSGPQMTEAPLLYHTDADLAGVAAAIGIRIDWNVVDR